MNVVGTILVLLAPVSLIYGWVCYFTPKGEETAMAWAGDALVISAGFAVDSAVARDDGVNAGSKLAKWRGSRAPGSTGLVLGEGHLSFFAGGAGSGFAGRPRLILPIVVGSLGTALLWLFSTME